MNIDVLIPLLKDGWVAMDENGWWNWFSHKPSLRIRRSKWVIVSFRTDFCPLGAFDIAHAEDWTQSLIKIERKDK